MQVAGPRTVTVCLARPHLANCHIQQFPRRLLPSVHSQDTLSKLYMWPCGSGSCGHGARYTGTLSVQTIRAKEKRNMALALLQKSSSLLDMPCTSQSLAAIVALSPEIHHHVSPDGQSHHRVGSDASAGHSCGVLARHGKVREEV